MSHVKRRMFGKVSSDGRDGNKFERQLSDSKVSDGYEENMVDKDLVDYDKDDDPYPKGGSKDSKGQVNGEKNKKKRRSKRDYGLASSFCGRQFRTEYDPKLAPGLLPGYGSASDADVSVFRNMPALRDVAVGAERDMYFQKKLVACGNVVFDFSVDLFRKEKESKRRCLLEMIEYISSNRVPLTELLVNDALNMISVNIFRDLPTRVGVELAEDDDPPDDLAWPHLQVVYEFFMGFVVSNEYDAKIIKNTINQSFILKLLELFQSEDQREREYLKSILHRVYGKAMQMRQFIRRSIQAVFHDYMDGNSKPYGIAELLEILGSIINGFATPLKPEHKVMLEHTLIPLHKAPHSPRFQSALQYCMVQFVEKESSLIEPIILGLLKYWPATNTPKELCFINEVDDLLDIIAPESFDVVKMPLFRRLACCMESNHSQVAERVLYLWHPTCPIAPMIIEKRQDIFPILITALISNSKNHWSGLVNQMTYHVSRLLSDSDSKLFDSMSTENEKELERNAQINIYREKIWLKLRDDYSGTINDW